ncbi:MAG: SMC-Scp complex subunit ScpB [Deltaproteobacteria bacterium]
MEDAILREKNKSILESLIFIANRPITVEELRKVVEDMEPAEIKEAVDEIRRAYEERMSGVRVVEIAGGYMMVTAPSSAASVKTFYKIKNTERLSGPSLETLAIVAYKQPVTRVDIEAIRGVNADGVLRSLAEKNLVRVVGRKEVIGRPFVYGTTRFFLDYFGLKSLAELPKIEEFAQQDMLMDMKLASGEADITPLTQEEQESLSREQQGQPPAEDNRQPTAETSDAPQEDPTGN